MIGDMSKVITISIHIAGALLLSIRNKWYSGRVFAIGGVHIRKFCWSQFYLYSISYSHFKKLLRVGLYFIVIGRAGVP